MSGIALDKNELPWGLDDELKEALIKGINEMDFNRYPDSNGIELRTAISGYTGIDTESICIGNGSDELISLLLQTFIEPGDTIAIYNPTFGMYVMYGAICGAKIWKYDLDSNFELKLDEFITSIKKEKPKAVFLCNPNNPTGKELALWEIEEILKETAGIVVVDEAYFEFSGVTAAERLTAYDNLIILRTFSKAFGLAGLRVGYMLAGPSIISYINRVRSPFNVNVFAQAAAIEVLKNIDKVRERVEIVISERERLLVLLNQLEGLQCFESKSNFVLMRTPFSEKIFRRLQEAGIFIRRYSNRKLEDCLRVTVGSRLENDKFYDTVKEALYERA